MSDQMSSASRGKARELLLEYLAAVGIRADDGDFYGPGALVVQVVDYDRVQLTAEQVRDDLGWHPTN